MPMYNIGIMKKQPGSVTSRGGRSLGALGVGQVAFRGAEHRVGGLPYPYL